MPPPPTPRIAFRPWSQDVRDDFAAMARNPKVVEHIPPGTPWPDQRIDEFVTRQTRYEQERGFSMWWIGAASDRPKPLGPEPLDTAHWGLCGLQPVTGSAAVEIGWWLRPEAQGRGFASEAARAALAWAWEQTDLVEIYAHTVPANRPSCAVMERIGMERVGVLPPSEHGRQGVDLDLVVYRMARPD